MANEHSNIVPDMQSTSTVADFKFWCQAVLPLVYDDSLSYYEVLSKMTVYLNQVIDNINATTANVTELEADFLLLQTYVNTFFDDIDQLVTYAQRAEAAQTAAASSATNAATSATNAASSATNAASSATNAASSASNAASSSLSAMDAKDAAIAAKTAAQTALTNAQTAATNAANSATAASGSATAASGSATNAAASATAAQQSYTLADAARVAAQSAASSAESASELIDMDATASDVGKAIIVKTVGDGKVTAYEFGETGGGTGGTGGIVNTIENVPVASFDDGTDTPVVELVVNIDPVQSGSGDPTPNNVRPITGWTECNIYDTGKNIFDASELVFTDGKYLDANGAVADSAAYTCTTNFYPCHQMAGLQVTTNICTTSASSSIKSMAFYSSATEDSVVGTFQKADGTDTTMTFTVPATAKYLRCCLTKNNIPETMVIVTGTEIPTPIPPFGTTYNIDFPVGVGTVYGGTLSWDAENGWVLTVDRGSHIVDGENALAVSISEFSSDSEFVNLRGKIGANIRNANTWYNHDAICSHFVYTKYASRRTTPLPSAFQMSSSSVTCICMDGYTTTEQYNEYFQQQVTNGTPVTIVYELENPIVYTMTDEQAVTLLGGTNNVWADTGDIKLIKYNANGKQYIDERDSLVKTLIAKELDSMVADTALVANDFRIVNNTLYKITANIASGGTLTPNTNCVATTVGEVLKTLLT